MLPLIILTGPTTSNKSDTAIKLAEKIDGEIISADSMQIYKYFENACRLIGKKCRAHNVSTVNMEPRLARNLAPKNYLIHGYRITKSYSKFLVTTL